MLKINFFIFYVMLTISTETNSKSYIYEEKSNSQRNINFQTACDSSPSYNDSFCNGHGKCVIDPQDTTSNWTMNGYCECEAGWYGNQCETPICQDNLECNGLG